MIEPRALNRHLLVDWLQQAWPGCRIDALEAPASLPDDPAPVTLALVGFGRERLCTPSVVAAIQALRERIGDAPLVILGEREDRVAVADALAIGARGYVPTSFDTLAAIRAIEFVLAGGTFVPAEAVTDTWRGPTGDPSGAPAPGGFGQRGGEAGEPPVLTPRERDVAALVCAGKPNKLIAHELRISESTVKVFVRRILSKLGVTNRTEAAFALRQHRDDGAARRNGMVVEHRGRDPIILPPAP